MHLSFIIGRVSEVELEAAFRNTETVHNFYKARKYYIC